MHKHDDSMHKHDGSTKSLLPQRVYRRASFSSDNEAPDALHSPILPDAEDTSKTHKKSTRATLPQWHQRVSKRALAAALCVGMLIGYYAQLLVFFLHVRLGFTGAILPTSEDTRHANAVSLIEHMTRVIYVCKKTNWDYIGFIATPHTVLFTHADVFIPPSLRNTLRVIRHTGTDSFMNLHNKTLTMLSHVHRADPTRHVLKQDEEAILYYPHIYACLQQCTDIATCYAGSMHVNIGSAVNANSFVFASGGSYFIGSQLLHCLLASPAKVEVDGLDFGEDKMVGKMLHYNKCNAQIVNCKWFNNLEIYSPHAMVRLDQEFAVQITPDTKLRSKAQQEAAALRVAAGGPDASEDLPAPPRDDD